MFKDKTNINDIELSLDTEHFDEAWEQEKEHVFKEKDDNFSQFT